MQSFNGIAVFNTAYLRRHFVMLALVEFAGKVPVRKSRLNAQADYLIFPAPSHKKILTGLIPAMLSDMQYEGFTCVAGLNATAGA